MSAIRPVIGISTYREQARFRTWDTLTDLLPARYAVSIETAGGIPVLLPQVADAAPAVVARLDGLVIAGGNDVDPARYGEPPHPATGGWRSERDAWELALLDAADARGLPTLGICRGMQLMAVWAGGSLVQHVPDVVGDSRHSPGPDAYGPIEIEASAGSAVQQLLGESFSVHCHHHQSVASAPGYRMTARASDGTQEAMESERHPFWMAVQWHPEVLEDYRLFAGLVTAASAR
ncbi:MAG TPA: gamma-glutamyl-gamma-aminobutyrate hydrolase family protein [Propionibacteriaceae bacterium]|nr:gamma-glutamyl-gamma-aminobutyrate hydrolase family protein [Propionibacteriaceae bacterium]